MIRKFGLVGHKWLVKIYKKKHGWNFAYMKDVFTAEIRSTQLSESVNSRVKNDLGSGMSMERFFIGFDLFFMGVRERESQSECNSRQTVPHLAASSSPILIQAAKVYTPNMFRIFNNEWDSEHGITLAKYCGSLDTTHVRVANDKGSLYEINYNPSTMTISCSCCTYEMQGYLCAHILRVFNVYEIHEIPEKYTMKRWTKMPKVTSHVWTARHSAWMIIKKLTFFVRNH